MSDKLTKNNEFWNKIFEKYDIIHELEINGKFEITAKQINEFREARLMTKFDNKSSLPKIFADNKLSILPITRGSYIIAPFNIFYKFPTNVDESEIIYGVKLPEHIRSIDTALISTESMVINCAYLSGILHDFIEDQDLVATINGRMSSDSFNFAIKNTKTYESLNLSVEKAQIEIDGGYEGINTLVLIEAKLNFSDDFIIRQLYYPFRKWHGKINKQIKSVFMVYSNNIYYLFEYIFQDPNNYNSLILNKSQRYSFNKLYINLLDIQEIIQNITIINEPEIPFPQANSFARIINLCEILKNENLTKESITTNYGFDKRQTDYYINACRYLGLCEINDPLVSLTLNGLRIINLEYRAKQLEFIKLILQHAVFKDVIMLKLNNGGNPLNKLEIINLMKKYPLYNMNDERSTVARRASTIDSWVNWIIGLIHNE